MFLLLSGHYAEAKNSYNEFCKRGPSEEDYESTLGVLRQMQESLQAAGSHLAEHVSEMIALLANQQ